MGHNVQEGTGDFFLYKSLKGSGKTVGYCYEKMALNTNVCITVKVKETSKF